MDFEDYTTNTTQMKYREKRQADIYYPSTNSVNYA